MEHEGDHDELQLYFGSLYSSVVTLFRSIANGLTWGQAADSLEETGFFWVQIFHLYVAFCSFALLNVMTGWDRWDRRRLPFRCLFLNMCSSALTASKQESCNLKIVCSKCGENPSTYKSQTSCWTQLDFHMSSITVYCIPVERKPQEFFATQRSERQKEIMTLWCRTLSKPGRISRNWRGSYLNGLTPIAWGTSLSLSLKNILTIKQSEPSLISCKSGP